MFTVRRLTTSDALSLRDFIVLRMKDSELGADYLHFAVFKSHDYFDQSQDSRILLGAFENEKLVATMGMYFDEASPIWLLFYMVTSRSSFNYNLKLNGLADLIEHALDIAEGRQVYRYYTFMKKRILPFTYDKWFTYVPRLKNYTFVIEDVIPANTKSKYPLFNNFGFNKIYSEDYIIRSATAQDSVRIYKDAYNRY